MLITQTVIAILISTSAQATAKEKLIDRVSELYRKTPLIEMRVEKKVTAELLSKETTITGKMTTGRGFFRWESQDPDKTLVIYDGKYLWNVQYPSADFGGDIQVTKALIKKENKAQILPALIISSEPLKNHFDVVGEKEDEKFVSYELRAKAKDFLVKSIFIKVDKLKKTINELSYSDEAGSTTFTFLETSKKKTFSKQPFLYKPEVGAKVTEL